MTQHSTNSRRFYDIGSDVNWVTYGALHANVQHYATYDDYDANRPYNGTTINVVQFINWEGETGSCATGYDSTNDNGDTNGSRQIVKYAIECRTIDMAFYTRQDINHALECCGSEPLPTRRTDMPTPLQLAYVMHSYGHGDTETLYGNNAYKLLALAKRRMI